MSFLKTTVMTVAVISLAACANLGAGNEVEKLNEANAGGSPFTQQLTTEYRAFSNYELKQEKDYADALHFARKGLAAAKGTNVMPEPVTDWDLSAPEIQELSAGYLRLVAALDRGAREIMPGKAAIAQARFDCWIEEQEEVDGEVGCKNDFLAVMNELEGSLTPAPQPSAEEFPEPIGMIDNNEPLNVQDAMYLVFFDFDKSNINQGASNVIDTVMNEIKAQNIQTIRIVGHTDTSGSDAYNQKLSKRRAEAVKAQLVQMGVPAAQITTDNRGESDLLVQTQDGIREHANRRSVITFE